MELNSLTAISAADGRYRKQIQHLDDYFSEYALMKYRVIVEIEYLLFLASKKIIKLSPSTSKLLTGIKNDFNLDDAREIKKLEQVTNHDVKAVEYFIKQRIQKTGEKEILEWVHFGLTSQDINNTAVPLLWKHALEFEYLPALLN